MVRIRIGLLGGALATGGLGWVAGAHYQRGQGEETQVRLPGLPRGASVSLARPLSLQVEQC